MSWENTDNKLIGRFVFSQESEATSFCDKVKKRMDEVNHHGPVTVSKNEVSISLTTHDAGNVVTEKDENLAALISEMAQEAA